MPVWPIASSHRCTILMGLPFSLRPGQRGRPVRAVAQTAKGWDSACHVLVMTYILVSLGNTYDEKPSTELSVTCSFPCLFVDWQIIHPPASLYLAVLNMKDVRSSSDEAFVPLSCLKSTSSGNYRGKCRSDRVYRYGWFRQLQASQVGFNDKPSRLLRMVLVLYSRAMRRRGRSPKVTIMMTFYCCVYLYAMLFTVQLQLI